MSFIYLAVPLAAVVLSFLIKNRKAIYGVVILSSLITMLLTLWLTYVNVSGGGNGLVLTMGILYIDSFSIIVLDIITILGFFIHIYSAGYIERDYISGKIDEKQVKLYFILMNAFVFTMLVSVSVKNVGILWVAIEATTLASVFLVGFYNKRESLEAAWKYIIICSVGIALAFLGIVFLHLSSTGVIASPSQVLNFTDLTVLAKGLDSSVLKFAFIFILLGFGTKVGLAPMHTWLPAAHSQAPSPVSAMLSGVLLNSAMYGIIRTMTIVNVNLGSNVFTGRLMIFFGLLSIAIAAIVILTQKDYKSLLAYSSIEHMGVIALAAGFFTPASLFAALLHMINHSFTKSMLFLSTGNILQKYHTTNISRIKGILKVLPVSGTVFIVGLLAIAGTPPFGIFSCEWNILTAVFSGKHYIIGSVTAVLLAVVFAGIVHCVFKMFFGEPPSEVESGEDRIAGTAVIVVLLIIVAALGLFMPDAAINLLNNAQAIISGGVC